MKSWSHNIAAAAPSNEFLNATVERFLNEFRDKPYCPSGLNRVGGSTRTPKKQINSAETTLHNQQFSAEGGGGWVSGDLQEV